ncbi:hypothetical protein C0J29_31525 (plasmid) [Mycobacterium paragordonae]|nr:hypothetical protein C0J29_31525 [Mycobacterium paragordonae]
MTLDGLSKNHAMTFIHSATTRRTSRSGPARTPPCWTQPNSARRIRFQCTRKQRAATQTSC